VEVVYSTGALSSLAEADLQFMREGLPRELQVNISYHPESDSIPRLATPRSRAGWSKSATHGQRVEAFLRRACPVPAGHRTTSSAHRGARRSSPRRQRAVHIDAGAYGATNGARIFRFFVNIHPTRDRVWGTKGSFGTVMRRHPELWDAAKGGKPRVPIDKGPFDKLYSGLIGAVGKLYPLARHRLEPLRPIDASHPNYMKEDPRFRDSREGYQEIHFPPLSAWMVFTDGISHSVLTGQHALVTTVLIPLENCRIPELTPYEVLAHSAA
jgi:hypothetical protein